MSQTISNHLTNCGVLLLPEVCLLPNNLIPIHIFENRYRIMLQDALDSERCFAIGNLVSKESKNLTNCVAPVGVLVKIKACKELEDGRSLIMIEGLEPVRFSKWNSAGDYPSANILPLGRVKVDDEPTVKDLILDTLQPHLDAVKGKVKSEVELTLKNIPTVTELLDFIAHHFIQDPAERQYYLEERSDSARASKLMLYLSDA